MKRIGKQIKKIDKEHIWLGCLAIGPLTAYAAVFNPALTIVAIVFILIGIKGTLVHIM